MSIGLISLFGTQLARTTPEPPSRQRDTRPTWFKSLINTFQIFKEVVTPSKTTNKARHQRRPSAKLKAFCCSGCFEES